MIQKIIRLPYNLYKFIFSKSILNTVIEPGKGCDDHSSMFETYLYRKKIDRIKRYQQKEYTKKTTQVKCDRSFIFFPLHAQPEYTTNPVGGVFVDQVRIVELLIRSIPTEWDIVIKEHKVQFDERIKRLFPRKKDFYDRLQLSGRVIFADIDISPFDLIDQSVAVATVSGDAGWEAVNRGKPVLLFGGGWYYGCEGVFSVATYDDAQAAIEIIKNGYTVNEKKVKLFLLALQTVCIKASMDSAHTKAYSISDEQTVREITSVLRGLN